MQAMVDYEFIFSKYFLGVPHLATFISFSNVIDSFALTIQYTVLGFEPTTTQIHCMRISHAKSELVASQNVTV
jgi:hypothetical protein